MHNMSNFIVLIENKLCVFDAEFKDQIMSKKWKLNVGYAYSSLFMHKYIMKIAQPDKNFDNKNMSIDHLNRIPLDNRLSNLRYTSIANQNINTGSRQRKIELPEYCDIDVSDIPRGVWYVAKDKRHEERFCVQLKAFRKDNREIYWKTPSISGLSLKFKLECAKKYIRWLINTYPGA